MTRADDKADVRPDDVDLVRGHSAKGHEYLQAAHQKYNSLIFAMFSSSQQSDSVEVSSL